MRSSWSSEDRTAAALGYVVPIIGPLYLLATMRSRPFVWRNAIQALVIYLLIAVVVNMLKPVEAVWLEQSAILIGVLVLIAFAFLTYRGRSLRLPWIADLADRWQGAGAAAIDAGVAVLKNQMDLALHARHLARGAVASPRELLPKVAGKAGPEGFELEFASGLGALAASLVGQRATPFFTRGEVVVAKWPLRLGDESVVHYRAWPREGVSVERIFASLKCVEKIHYRDAHDSLATYGMLLQTIDVADSAGHKAADGSVGAKWTLRVPREGPPSLAADGGSIEWLLEVEVRLEGGRPSQQSFELLVMPEAASP